MPAWSRRPRRPAWVKLKRRKKKKKQTRKKTKKKTGKNTKDAGTASHWMRELLKLLTSVNPEFQEDAYHYNPRHYSKDPEYQWSDPRTQAFKREIPAPDVHYFNPPGDQPPHLGMRGGFHKREDGWVHVNVIDPGAD